MSPQFVDFDGDGQLDIVAGIFDGSPHLVRGSDKGWGKPEQILDREGERIVLNQYWDFDIKQWVKTRDFDAPGTKAEGQCTSAVAFDWDGDGDLDLLLGDYNTGAVFRRMNEGTAAEPLFSRINEVVHAAGAPIEVPGKVATLRLVDWNADGRLDLACGGMGDVYNDDEGGGVFLYLNEGEGKTAAFGKRQTLLAPSAKGQAEPTRPDAGLYMDFADHDGDGDLDMVVGGYSLWKMPEPTLNAVQKERVRELKDQQADLNTQRNALSKRIMEGTEGLDRDAADKLRKERLAEFSEDLSAIGKRIQNVNSELEKLEGGAKRRSMVWLYENLGNGRTAAADR